MKKLWITLCVVAALGFVAVIAYSGRQLGEIDAAYAREAEIHRLVSAYRPDSAPEHVSHSENADAAQSAVINQSVLDLQAQYPDAVGWLTIPHTQIDYPIVQYKDNDYFLRRDITGAYANAGTIFMDCRSRNDFASQNTIIYGHHMKNGSMFGSLKHFDDQAFFDENSSGTVYLPHDTLTLEFFAYMVVDPSDREIFNTAPNDAYLDYVRQNARHYREIGLASGDRIVTLSTCSYEFADARMVLLARIT